MITGKERKTVKDMNYSGKKLFVKYNNSLAIDEIVVPVNYCPMCGRKLVEE